MHRPQAKHTTIVAWRLQSPIRDSEIDSAGRTNRQIDRAMRDTLFAQPRVDLRGVVHCDAPTGRVHALRSHELLERSGKAEFHAFVVNIALLDLTAVTINE